MVPAAGGVAAVLAAIMTVSVVPIDGALAIPPTSNVIVVNPATEPALNRSVDDPGRIAYQKHGRVRSEFYHLFFRFFRGTQKSPARCPACLWRPSVCRRCEGCAGDVGGWSKSSCVRFPCSTLIPA